jgi:hypothetical protein
MANPPPPYDNITGISRAVMKDNAQETVGEYNGVARPSELVVDQLTQNLYVGNTNGNLNLVAYGSGVTSSTVFNPQFTDGSGTFAGGTLHQTAGAGSPALYHIAGITDVADSTTVMKLYYSGSTTDLVWKFNTPATGAWQSGAHFDISGTYQIA